MASEVLGTPAPVVSVELTAADLPDARPPRPGSVSAAQAVVEPWIASDVSRREWAELAARAPQLTATMRRYLVQLSTFLPPRSVEAADMTLRQTGRRQDQRNAPVTLSRVGRASALGSSLPVGGIAPHLSGNR